MAAGYSVISTCCRSAAGNEANAATVSRNGIREALSGSELGFVEVDNSSELYFTSNAVTSGEFEELKVGMLVEVTRATDERAHGTAGKVDQLLDRAKTPSWMANHNHNGIRDPRQDGADDDPVARPQPSE